MPLLLLDQVAYSGWKLLDYLLKDVKEEEKGDFYAFQTLVLQELHPLLQEKSLILDLKEYSREYPWPLDHVIRYRDILKKKFTKTVKKTLKEKKEIIGIIEKYVQGKDVKKELVDYWIYCSICGILKSKDEELVGIVKGSRVIQDFMNHFSKLVKT